MQILDRLSTMYPIPPTPFRSIVTRRELDGLGRSRFGWVSGLGGRVSATALPVFTGVHFGDYWARTYTQEYVGS
jgi:hypothetical protein